MIRSTLAAVVLIVLASDAWCESDASRLLENWGEPPADQSYFTVDSTLRESIIVRGTVVAIDPENRLFALQSSNGRTATIYADEDIENFDRLSLGQPATVRYAEAEVLALARNGVFRPQKTKSELAPSAGPSSPQAYESAADLMRPQISIFGRVTAIDLRNGHITVENEDGWQIEMRVTSDKTLSGVRIGERVLITYAEAAAISIQPDLGSVPTDRLLTP